MKYRIFSGWAAAAVLCASLFPAPHEFTVLAEDAGRISVTVDVNASRTPISPLIYGINNSSYLDDVSVNAVRQGGNRYTAYNWETNFSNAGADWQHYSDAGVTSGYDPELAAKPGACTLRLSADALANGGCYKLATIQTAGYAAGDDGGTVTEAETAPSARWKEVRAFKGSVFSLQPDTSDDYVYMDEYVNYLVQTLGDASTAAGIQAYSLDNEPGLWNETHPRLHPEQPTCAEIIEKSIEFASAVKSVDPKAEVFAPALYGMGTFMNLKESPDWAEYAADYDWYISCYLDHMARAEQEKGQRLLDVLDVHYYSDAIGEGDCRVTNCMDSAHTGCVAARLQAPRSLYDPDYLENSWIAKWYPQFLPVLPLIRSSIDTYYPGTKLAVTEYNFGGGDHISGALAQADVLGIFAENEVYMAALWPLSQNIDYQLSAMELYTNYDGRGASFGDTLIPSSVSDRSLASSYAAIHGEAEDVVTLVLMNKSLTSEQNAEIILNSEVSYRSAAVYGLTEEASSIRLMGAVEEIRDNQFTLCLPPLSVVQVEISAEEFRLDGDVNLDGAVSVTDAVALTGWLLQRPSAAIAGRNADLDHDGMVTAFDLAMLKRMLIMDIVPEELPVFYEMTEAGKWKVREDMAGNTLTCTFSGKGGYTATIGYGYWDTAENVWVQDETTQFESMTFNSSKELTVSFDVPETASSLQVQVYYYAVYENGALTKHDISEVSLLSMTYH